LKARKSEQYLEVPFTYGKNQKVCLYIHKDLIEKTKSWTVTPENFMGVNIKMILDRIK